MQGGGVSVEGTNKFSSHNDTIKVSRGGVHTVSRVAEGRKLSANSAQHRGRKRGRSPAIKVER